MTKIRPNIHGADARLESGIEGQKGARSDSSKTGKGTQETSNGLNAIENYIAQQGASSERKAFPSNILRVPRPKLPKLPKLPGLPSPTLPTKPGIIPGPPDNILKPPVNTLPIIQFPGLPIVKPGLPLKPTPIKIPELIIPPAIGDKPILAPAPEPIFPPSLPIGGPSAPAKPVRPGLPGVIVPSPIKEPPILAPHPKWPWLPGNPIRRPGLPSNPIRPGLPDLIKPPPFGRNPIKLPLPPATPIDFPRHPDDRLILPWRPGKPGSDKRIKLPWEPGRPSKPGRMPRLPDGYPGGRPPGFPKPVKPGGELFPLPITAKPVLTNLLKPPAAPPPMQVELKQTDKDKA
jgi:hypothetical protein